jgi:ABC-2 type transport system permease protein
MERFKASVFKEVLLLLHDKVGLLLMYMMPLLLVFVITIVQDSAFRLVNENRLDILIVNNDKGVLGDTLISSMKSAGSFRIDVRKGVNEKRLSKLTLEGGKLATLYIPENFSATMSFNSKRISKAMLTEFGVEPEGETGAVRKQNSNDAVKFLFDPVLQESYQVTIKNNLQIMISGIESKQMIHQLYKDMGYDQIPPQILTELGRNRTKIVAEPAMNGESAMIPNSTQHNVPAWSIFAMFFMVISLGGNLVKERVSGSFVRLQTIPGAFLYAMFAKITVYSFVALTQLMIMCTIGVFVLPLIGLPELNLPTHMFPFILISVLSAMAAISYAAMVGTYARTQEQANGFGAVSIIIFAAIGGIWVPSFVMPDYMLMISKISPLHWCLEGFYTLFLKNGSWEQLMGPVYYLISFTVFCQAMALWKLRRQHYI